MCEHSPESRDSENRSRRDSYSSQRKPKFFSLAALNQAIAELDRLNHRAFRKLAGNRIERFAKIDRPALRPCRTNLVTLSGANPE